MLQRDWLLVLQLQFVEAAAEQLAEQLTLGALDMVAHRLHADIGRVETQKVFDASDAYNCDWLAADCVVRGALRHRRQDEEAKDELCGRPFDGN